MVPSFAPGLDSGPITAEALMSPSCPWLYCHTRLPSESKALSVLPRSPMYRVPSLPMAADEADASATRRRHNGCGVCGGAIDGHAYGKTPLTAFGSIAHTLHPTPT